MTTILHACYTTTIFALERPKNMINTRNNYALKLDQPHFSLNVETERRTARRVIVAGWGDDPHARIFMTLRASRSHVLSSSSFIGAGLDIVHLYCALKSAGGVHAVKDAVLQ